MINVNILCFLAFLSCLIALFVSIFIFSNNKPKSKTDLEKVKSQLFSKSKTIVFKLLQDKRRNERKRGNKKKSSHSKRQKNKKKFIFLVFQQIAELESKKK